MEDRKRKSREKLGTIGFSFDLSIDLANQLKALCEKTRRSIREEVSSAIERHLASPPQIILGDLPVEELEPAKPARRSLGGKKDD